MNEASRAPVPGVADDEVGQPGVWPAGRFDMSVIVPLAFDRGLALECVRRWTHGQNYPRNRYQMILAAPRTMSAERLEEFRALIQPWDRLDRYPADHDMNLVAEAAKVAESELLLFTESHCLPKPEALSSLLETARTHPEWTGFSSVTSPLTHNLLSQVERDTYLQAFRANAEVYPWMKVLDQCFVVRRDGYFRAGGFQAEYGHFAEWLLAARFRTRGLQLGFDPTEVLEHYYVGKIDDLEDFTLDFAAGQIKYLAERAEEETEAWFPWLPELQEYRQRNRDDFLRMAQACVAAFPAWVRLSVGKYRRREPRQSGWRLLDYLAESLLTAAFGVRGDHAHARWTAHRARRRLKAALKREDRAGAQAAFIGWFGALVRRGRLNYLVHARKNRIEIKPERNPDFAPSGRWISDKYSVAEVHGFYDEEIQSERAFRWSKPVACVFIPMYPGRYRIVLEWLPVRPLDRRELVEVTFGDRRLPVHALEPGGHKLVIDVESPARGWHRLGWTVYPFPADDARPLGLPVTTIRWFGISASGTQPAAPANGAADSATYFMHISKCAGTATRVFLDNAYSADRIMAPYFGSYGWSDLADNPMPEVPYELYRGHFGYRLPASLPHRAWEILTVLRDPVDRCLSRFYYLKQLKLIHPATTFANWLEYGIRVHETITGFLVVSEAPDRVRGGSAVRAYSVAQLDEARANLSRCRVVGLQERIEDTINLFAWHLGILPPLSLPRNNPTLNRDRVRDLPEALRARVEEVMEADRVLYRQAETQFHAAMAAMLAAVRPELGEAPDTGAVRRWLRARYINRMAEAASAEPEPDRVQWHPDDVFHGENLHEREVRNGTRLRWTGPNETTRFLFYLGRPRDWRCTIELHSATPVPHVEQARLQVNGVAVALQREDLPDGAFRLTGRIGENALRGSTRGVAAFELATPLVRGEREFRTLGVALLAMTFQAAGPI